MITLNLNLEIRFQFNLFSHLIATAYVTILYLRSSKETDLQREGVI